MTPLHSTPAIALTALCHEFCLAVDAVSETVPVDFARSMLGLLPRIYITAFGITPMSDEDFIPAALSEDEYETVRERLASVFGENDTFLEPFHEDMKFSETPIASSLSELLADLYQVFYDFTAIVRQLPADSLGETVSDMATRFREYWSETLCNAMRVINHLYMNDRFSYES